MNPDVSKPWPRPGTVVSVAILLVYRHKGVVSDRWHNGQPMVISSSARSGGVREEPWGVFAHGREINSEGYPGKLPTWEVLQRARSLIGSAYGLFNRNCEHFVSHVHGLEPKSPQVAITLGIALLVSLFAAAR